MAIRFRFSRTFKTRTISFLFPFLLVFALVLFSFTQNQGEEQLVLHTVRRCRYVREVPLSFVCFGSAVSLFCSGDSIVSASPDGKVQKGAALLCGYPLSCDRLLSLVTSLSALSEKSDTPTIQAVRDSLLSFRLAESNEARSRAKKSVSVLIGVPEYTALSKTSDTSEVSSQEELSLLLSYYRSLLPPAESTVSAQCDGWFFSECDGKEAVWDTLSDPGTLSLSQMRALYESEEADGKTPDGKLYTSPVWYAATLVGAEVGAFFHTGESYFLPFPDGTVSGKLVTNEGDGNETLLLFSVYGIPRQGIVRRQSCFVVCERFSALRVPTVCLHTSEDGQAFVFVLRGQKILARAVSVRNREDGYTYLYDLTERRYQSGAELQPLLENESAVLSGGDLFHLKILNTTY